MTPGEPRLTELALIRALRERARQAPGVRVGIGDDCAVLEAPGGSLLLATTDLLIEDVHFRRRYAEPADIGWKALAVNVSDIASMGGRPRWALIALACPASTTMDEVEAFYEGIHALGDEHDVSVVGGDTSASPTGWPPTSATWPRRAARPRAWILGNCRSAPRHGTSRWRRSTMRSAGPPAAAKTTSCC